MDNTQEKRYSLLEIEDFLVNNRVPPGIEEYNDMPSDEQIIPTESKVEKIKKPWETEENLKNLNIEFQENNK